MLFLLGFIFMAVGSFCVALGSIFDYLGAAKEDSDVEYDDVIKDVEEAETTEEATEE